MRLLRQQAYEHIREKIVSGDLLDGSLLSESSLARDIGIGRMPVREALRQLHAEGLVEQIPRYGTMVRSPDPAEIAELYEVREALESYAAAAAARSISHESLALMRRFLDALFAIARRLQRSGRKALDGQELRRFLRTDMAFHAVLLEAVGNQRMMKIISELRVLVKVFALRRQQHTLPVISRTCLHHWRIYNAVRHGDSEGARKWMAHHLGVSKRYIINMIDHSLGDTSRSELDLDALAMELLGERSGLERLSRRPVRKAVA